jgi:hypothetical protein
MARMRKYRSLPERAPNGSNRPFAAHRGRARGRAEGARKQTLAEGVGCAGPPFGVQAPNASADPKRTLASANLSAVQFLRFNDACGAGDHWSIISFGSGAGASGPQIGSLMSTP